MQELQSPQPTPEKPEHSKGDAYAFSKLAEAFDKVTAQRDALLAACKAVVGKPWEPHYDLQAAFKMCEAIIADIEKGAK